MYHATELAIDAALDTGNEALVEMALEQQDENPTVEKKIRKRRRPVKEVRAHELQQ